MGLRGRSSEESSDGAVDSVASGSVEGLDSPVDPTVLESGEDFERSSVSPGGSSAAGTASGTTLLAILLFLWLM